MVLEVPAGAEGTDEGELNLCSYFLLPDHCIFKTSSVESCPARLSDLLFLLAVICQPLGFHSDPLTVLAPSPLSFSSLCQSSSQRFQYLGG